LAFVAVGLASPVAADEAPEPRVVEDYRRLTSVAPRRTNCAAGADAREILVCGRRQENLRYRLPLPSAPDPGARAARNVRSERFALTRHRAEGGSGSCSTVGPNGVLGCVALAMREREEAGDGPGLVARFLTFLDPDE